MLQGLNVYIIMGIKNLVNSKINNLLLLIKQAHCTKPSPVGPLLILVIESRQLKSTTMKSGCSLNVDAEGSNFIDLAVHILSENILNL